MKNDGEIKFDPRLDEFFDLAESGDQNDIELNSPSYYSLITNNQQYKFIDVVASGGMKSIWRVYDQRAQRYIAIAKLLDETSIDLYDPFIHEAWLTAKLDHPNIIKVHDVGLDENKRPYFSMDLKAGADLSEILKGLETGDLELTEKYSLRELLNIFLKVCDALSYAHSQEIIHLDIKPENIQVGDFGEVLICDWGLGKYIGQDEPVKMSDDELLLNGCLLSQVTLDGIIKGTPGYMAPEQIKNPASRNEETDIYGLGGVLYSILTFKRPLSGSDVLVETLSGQIVPPRERCPQKEIPQSLSAVAMKALKVEQGERYDSVRELKLEVQKYLSGYSTIAENASFLKEVKLLYKRNLLLSNFMMIAVFLICTVVTLSFERISQSRNEELLARQKAEENLDKYINERNTTTVLREDLHQKVIKAANSAFIKNRFKTVDSILKKALADDPTSIEILKKLFTYHYSIQRFNEAHSYYLKIVSLMDGKAWSQSRAFKRIDSLCQKYGQKKNDDSLLATEEVLDILGSYDWRYLHIDMVNYHL
ncbi:MAG: serine/threonine protein kinase, partial [Lentisphaeraceae bacterium]|nr:serine/threonine protein kinase [Lentisphaeraceae bacterium]